ncbi:MAG: AraC family transcriptional regulator [Bacteroidota bacterium]|nr:AraC family transcriptional regulator [Bacteroidota bacterium]MDP4269412.1 AraC family transcriptional regulator [Bacteroidota bacterium]
MNHDIQKKAEGFRGERSIVLPQPIREELKKNEMTCDLFITDIGYYPKARGHYRSRPEGAKECILIYCIEGKGWIRFNDKRYTLSENQFCIIQPGLKHEYGADEDKPWSIYWLHFAGEKSRLFSSVFNQVNDIAPIAGHRIQQRLSIFEEIYQNLELGYSPENLNYVSMCLWHLLASFRYIQQFRVISNSQQVNVIQQTILFMKENIERILSVEEIANNAHYSISHLSLLFSQSTSYSLLEYFTQLKIQKACQFLDHTDLSIKDIAYKLGYNDPFYFSKVFKKQISLTPSQYKQRPK